MFRASRRLTVILAFLLAALTFLSVPPAILLHHGKGLSAAWNIGRPLIVAHRGANRSALENTLTAFRIAREQGADAIELDVRLCATGEVVVLHDPSPVGVGGPDVPISALSLKEVRRVWLYRGERICLLEDVLLDPSVPPLVNVDIKVEEEESGIERAVTDVIRRCGAEGRVVVSSFNPFVMERFTPPITRGMLYSPILSSRTLHRRYLSPYDRPEAIFPHVSVVDERFARFYKAMGVAILTWSADRPEDWDRLIDLGVTGIITDHPDQLRVHLSTRGIP